MAQQPTTAATTQTGERDEVCKEVFGKAYSSLASDHQTTINALGDDAFFEFTNLAKWWTEVDPTAADIPNIWNELPRLMWVSKAFRRFDSPAKGHAYWTQHVEPLFRRLADHYTASWASSSFLASRTLTIETFRKTIIAMCVRQRSPIFPTIREVDQQIEEQFIRLWEERIWEFRKQAVKVTFQTSGNIIADGTFDFQGMLGKYMVLVSGTASYRVEWVDATRFTELMAAFDGKTGRPRFAYDIDHGATKKVILIPKPDQAYTGYAIILKGPPTFGSLSSTDALSELPIDFRPYWREKVFAALMSQHGREDNDVNRADARAERERQQLLASYDDKGSSRSTALPHHLTEFADTTLSGAVLASRILGQIE